MLASSVTLLSGAQESAAQRVDVQIGYSPKKLFDTDLGIPVYMAGEELWVYADGTTQAVLTDPSGRVVTRKDISSSVAFLRRFTFQDPVGEWSLSISRDAARATYLIPVASRSFQPAVHKSGLFLEGGRLRIEGTIRFSDVKSRGDSLLVLATRGVVNASEVITNFIIDGVLTPIKVRLESSSRNSIAIIPQAEEVTPIEETPGEVGAQLPAKTVLLWSEISTNIPLVKKVGEALLITSYKEVFYRTPPLNMELGTKNAQYLLELPDFYASGRRSAVPYREGSLLLTLNIRSGNAVFTSEVPLVFTRGSGWTMPTNKIEIPSIKSESEYTFFVDPDTEVSYDLILITDIKGVQTIWSSNMKPRYGVIQVFNSLTSTRILDYEVTLSAPRLGTANKKGETFVLADEPLRIQDYSLSISGVKFGPGDVSPRNITVQPGRAVTVTVKGGEVIFEVRDEEGRPSSAGTLHVHRLSSEGKAEVQPLWSGKIEDTPILLPTGTYIATVNVESEEVSKPFTVDRASQKVEFVLLGVHFGPTPPSTSEFLLGSGILAGEGFLFYKVWKRAISRRAGREEA